DGGHNDSAGEVLAAWAAQRRQPLDLVFGMLTTKEPREFLAPLPPHVGRLRAVSIPAEEASLPAGDAAGAARDVGIADAAPAGDPAAALDDLIRSAEGPRTVLICGSLYLAGSVLAENG
ncbi:MAG TPA: bifunctional folylpolyglutamate synthase/dihydrofolate synthase, partial [Azospirillaceae bacterium]|nr:bifunctional folylpolyglutamate synthase/dihydrofolate synthase [Azospirillaceae bacterium]